MGRRNIIHFSMSEAGRVMISEIGGSNRSRSDARTVDLY
jgi:hypothetical protein